MRSLEENFPFECASCGFRPEEGSKDEVKSVYLSLGRYEDLYDNDANEERYRSELEKSSALIKAGGEIDFDEKELQRLEEQRRLVYSVTTVQILYGLFRLFLPAFIIIGVLTLLYYLLKYFG
jgi:hypothetical protein